MKHRRQILMMLGLVFIGTAVPGNFAVGQQTNAAYPERLSVEANLHEDLPRFSFRLRVSNGEPPVGIILVDAIEIRRSGNPEIDQLIEGFEAEIPVSGAGSAIEILDMNFDGYGDLRIIEFMVAGPNVPYLNWLFSPGSGQFIESSELNAIVSPKFDPVARRIESHSRVGADRYRTDHYEFVGVQPVLTRTELKDYLQPGVYQLTVSEKFDGDWHVVEQQLIEE